MKRLNFLLCFFLFVSLKGFCQTQLYGSWNVNCGVTGVDEGHPKCCAICPVDTQKTEKSDWKVSGFYMSFKKDSVEINMPSVKKDKTVPYIWDNTGNTLLFTFEGKKYQFVVESDTKNQGDFILKDPMHMDLYLQKKKTNK
jgi:hypothetical protein